jgi:glutathione peroxidase
MIKVLLVFMALITESGAKNMDQSIYDFTVKRIDGVSSALREYEGKTILIVNVASKCGLTPQYEGLKKLYDQYRNKGLVVLGFPANEFLGQEPGTNAEIQEFCQKSFGVNFPMHEKIIVKGDGQHPLYKFLTTQKPQATLKPNGTLIERLMAKNLIGKAHEIKWNFEKFLVNKQGVIVERFSPELEPLNPIIIKAIEQTL